MAESSSSSSSSSTVSLPRSDDGVHMNPEVRRSLELKSGKESKDHIIGLGGNTSVDGELFAAARSGDTPPPPERKSVGLSRSNSAGINSIVNQSGDITNRRSSLGIGRSSGPMRFQFYVPSHSSNPSAEDGFVASGMASESSREGLGSNRSGENTEKNIEEKSSKIEGPAPDPPEKDNGNITDAGRTPVISISRYSSSSGKSAEESARQARSRLINVRLHHRDRETDSSHSSAGGNMRGEKKSHSRRSMGSETEESVSSTSHRGGASSTSGGAEQPSLSSSYPPNNYGYGSSMLGRVSDISENNDPEYLGGMASIESDVDSEDEGSDDGPQFGASEPNISRAPRPRFLSPLQSEDEDSYLNNYPSSAPQRSDNRRELPRQLTQQIYQQNIQQGEASGFHGRPTSGRHSHPDEHGSHNQHTHYQSHLQQSHHHQTHPHHHHQHQHSTQQRPQTRHSMTIGGNNDSNHHYNDTHSLRSSAPPITDVSSSFSSRLYADGIHLLERAAKDAREREEVDTLNESIDFLRNLQSGAERDKKQGKNLSSSVTASLMSSGSSSGGSERQSARRMVPPPPPPPLSRPNRPPPRSKEGNNVGGIAGGSNALGGNAGSVNLAGGEQTNSVKNISASRTHRPPPPPRQSGPVPTTPNQNRKIRPVITAAEAMDFVLSASARRLMGDDDENNEGDVKAAEQAAADMSEMHSFLNSMIEESGVDSESEESSPPQQNQGSFDGDDIVEDDADEFEQKASLSMHAEAKFGSGPSSRLERDNSMHLRADGPIERPSSKHAEDKYGMVDHQRGVMDNSDFDGLEIYTEDQDEDSMSDAGEGDIHLSSNNLHRPTSNHYASEMFPGSSRGDDTYGRGPTGTEHDRFLPPERAHGRPSANVDNVSDILSSHTRRVDGTGEGHMREEFGRMTMDESQPRAMDDLILDSRLLRGGRPGVSTLDPPDVEDELKVEGSYNDVLSPSVVPMRALNEDLVAVETVIQGPFNNDDDDVDKDDDDDDDDDENEMIYSSAKSFDQNFLRYPVHDNGSLGGGQSYALGPRSRQPGGITGVVLDMDSDQNIHRRYRPSMMEKGKIRKDDSSDYDDITAQRSDPQDSVNDDLEGAYHSDTDKYTPPRRDADHIHGSSWNDKSIGGLDRQSTNLMTKLCAHLLPIGLDTFNNQEDEFFCGITSLFVQNDSALTWDDDDPDEPGYIVHQLTRAQLNSIENAFERMVNSFELSSEKRVRGSNDKNFERDLEEAEMILDQEEKRYEAEVKAAAASRLGHPPDVEANSDIESSETDGKVDYGSSRQGNSPGDHDSLGELDLQREFQLRRDENDMRSSVPGFPGIYPPGKGKPGEMECFYLPIITKSQKTGFEPTKDLVLKPGSVFANNYLVQSELGSAAFSTAYRCLDLSSEEDEEGYQDEVCLKVIKNTKDYFDQSLDEIKILRLLKDTGKVQENNIVEMKSFFYHREHLVIVTELLRQNLYEFGKSILESRGPPYFTRRRLSHITRQCLIGLRFVHELGLMHCDIKPENILLSSYSRALVKVIDFGSSSFVTDRQSSYIQSRSYRAPEVILGLPYGGKIDMWSLGCVVAEMYTGEVTFQNDSEVSMLSRIEAICGPFPRHMIAKGRNSHRIFTDSGLIYEKISRDDVEGSESRSNLSSDEDDSPSLKEDNSTLFNIYQPKMTTIAARLGFETDLLEQPRLSEDDEKRAMFVDFVRSLLTIDPDLRPTAAEALNHPWILSSLDLRDEDIRYPPE